MCKLIHLYICFSLECVHITALHSVLNAGLIFVLFFRPHLNFFIWPQGGAIIKCMTRAAPRSEIQHLSFSRKERGTCLHVCLTVFSLSTLGHKKKKQFPLQYFLLLSSEYTGRVHIVDSFSGHSWSWCTSETLKRFSSRQYNTPKKGSVNGRMRQKTAHTHSSFVLSLITETDNEALLFLFVSAASLNVLGWP